MQTVLHKANTRGFADHGWLKSYHSFSFANYLNRNRMHFASLRVLNDDTIGPSMGFNAHPHDNMEIITIPLKGALRHRDSMGNDFTISYGEVQTMSAGTGITHSEFNASQSEPVELLQIWIFPKNRDIKPAYSQKKFNPSERINQFQLVASPDGRQNSATINQDAFLSLIQLDEGHQTEYQNFLKTNSIYFFNINGSLAIQGQEISNRDGLGVEHQGKTTIEAFKKSLLLILEIPPLEL